jgi:hypothetical protein
MPKLTADTVPAGIDPATLSARANAHLEALVFVHENPDFLPSKQNSAFILAQFKQKGIEKPTAKDFADAYRKGLEAKKLLTRDEVRKVIQAGSAADLQNLVEREGIPRYDERGRFIGHDYPESFTEPVKLDSERSKQAGRATATHMSPIATDHPNDEAYRPSKREFAGWGPRRQREWLEAAGYWGRDLPDYLK